LLALVRQNSCFESDPLSNRLMMDDGGWRNGQTWVLQGKFTGVIFSAFSLKVWFYQQMNARVCR